MENNIQTMENNNSKIIKYLAYRELNKKFFILLGFSNTYSNIIYRIVPCIHLFLGITITLFTFAFVRVHYNNIHLLIKSFSIMTSFILVTLKITCLIIYKKEIFELHQSLDNHFMKLLEKKYLLQFIIHKVSKYRILSLSGLIFVFFCNFITNVMPLSQIISNYIHNIQPDDYIFPYPSLFPWPVPFTGFIYRLHFIYETFTSFTIVIVSPGADSIFVFFIFLIIGQLREISYSITHIDKMSDSNIIVKKCISQYCLLVKYCDTIQKIYGPIIICLMMTNAVVLCTSMYQITQMHSLSILKISLFFTYMTLKLIQTYMYSWCGTHLTIESENCRNAIYASNWFGDKRFMTAIKIMLQQRPLVLTACNIATVSVDIFSKILNTTVSYYFLLKTLE